MFRGRKGSQPSCWGTGWGLLPTSRLCKANNSLEDLDQEAAICRRTCQRPVRALNHRRDKTIAPLANTLMLFFCKLWRLLQPQSSLLYCQERSLRFWKCRTHTVHTDRRSDSKSVPRQYINCLSPGTGLARGSSIYHTVRNMPNTALPHWVEALSFSRITGKKVTAWRCSGTEATGESLLDFSLRVVTPLRLPALILPYTKLSSTGFSHLPAHAQTPRDLPRGKNLTVIPSSRRLPVQAAHCYC